MTPGKIYRRTCPIPSSLLRGKGELVGVTTLRKGVLRNSLESTRPSGKLQVQVVEEIHPMEMMEMIIEPPGVDLVVHTDLLPGAGKDVRLQEGKAIETLILTRRI
jgi:hypothetical protein